MSFKDLSGLMQQAQAMQEQLQEQMKAAEAEAANLRVTGDAGAGLVTVTMNGRFEVVDVSLDPSVLEEERSVIEDLIAAACNGAARSAAEAQKQNMAQAAQGFGMPGGFDLGALGDLFGKMK